MRTVTFTYDGCECSADVAREHGGYVVDEIYVRGDLPLEPQTYDEITTAAIDQFKRETATGPFAGVQS